MSEHSSISSILVSGTGLIGTSIALGLKTRGYEVFLSDIDATAQANAVAASGGSNFVDQTPDLVVVATPPATTAAVVSAALANFPEAIVTDVASVKGSIFSKLSGLNAAQLSNFVGGHPMAGREVSGAVGAQGNLFVDRPWVLIRNDATSDSAYNKVEAIVSELGAIPVSRTIAEHDLAVALISHTPQVVASVMATELIHANDEQVELAGQGIRDTIRIAGSDPGLWSEILKENADHVAARVKSVAAGLNAFADSLLKGDTSAISELLTKGNQGRDRLPGKHGIGTNSHSSLVVRLEDKPGELARLFQAAATAQVNLEDVRIDHSLGRMTGLVELSIAPASRDTLIAALTSAAFTVVS